MVPAPRAPTERQTTGARHREPAQPAVEGQGFAQTMAGIISTARMDLRIYPPPAIQPAS